MHVFILCFMFLAQSRDENKQPIFRIAFKSGHSKKSRLQAGFRFKYSIMSTREDLLSVFKLCLSHSLILRLL